MNGLERKALKRIVKADVRGVVAYLEVRFGSQHDVTTAERHHQHRTP
jgi:hypothetical protein